MTWWRWRTWRRARLTGVQVSVSGPTLTWEFSPSERARARDILHRLEDHRMLYAPYEFEEEEGVLESVDRLRAYLNEQVERCESVELRDQVRVLRAAVRQFLTDIESARRCAARTEWRDARRPYQELLFATQALGVLRGRAGVVIAEIGRLFRIPIDGDLAHVVPPDLTRAEGDEPLAALFYEDGHDSEYADEYPVRPATRGRDGTR